MMARHRFYQNAEQDYSDDEAYSYGSSYGTSYEEGLSTSLENKYVYKRGEAGQTPKMTSFMTQINSVANLDAEQAEFEMDLEIGSVPQGPGFEMDIDTGPPPERGASGSGSLSLRRQDSGVDTSSLTPEHQAKLNSALDYIQNIIGDTKSENHIKEILIANEFDSEKSLKILLEEEGPSKPPNTLQIQSVKMPELPPIGAVLSPSIVKPVSTPTAIGFSRATPTIDTTPRMTPSTESKSSAHGFKTPAVDQDEKGSRCSSPRPKVELLSIQEKSGRAGSPAGQKIQDLSASTPLKQVVMRKEKLNVVDRFKSDRGDKKEVLNLVVVGHVDSGKSTLMGHLLFKLGNVSQKIMHKYEKESKKVGKQSFMYAWVLDETEEERNRGITMDVGTNNFETEHRVVTLLDAPGHKDFIPNMISGAYQADVAVLVVNSTTGEFEAGFEAGGQTREHALLVRSLGISQLVIAVNKLDTVNWDSARFQEVKDKLKVFLTKQAGFREKDLNFIPCSGLTGENLCTGSTAEELKSWYTGPSLIQAIDQMKTPERAIEKPFRMSISDVFKGQSSGISVVGRVESGSVMKEDRLLATPTNDICQVKSVLVEQMDGQIGYAGDHVTLNLNGPDQMLLFPGQVLCDPSLPIAVTSKFRARIVIFNIDIPITKGYPVVLHYGCVSEQAIVTKLVATLSKSTGEILKNKPRFLNGNSSAIVEISITKPIPLETYKDNRELGRFMMRVSGNTIAAGMVTDIL